ncbi:hypothetical protein BD410DRAFT_719621 [Rickenella mellea]|uniref:HAT C-terminal dimerisation domain-containing protein n=1 Tax=Rickenella mellea TaxID=50990 RepID=A0A4Y7Q9H9_9AGAM|nr:hypothetical protein BD410DRAFT_719621 [Rickenella mellea]
MPSADYLSAAASTDVERAFSRGGLTVSKHRHALSDESTRAATVLNSWAQVQGLVPEATIIKSFKEKSSRPKASDGDGDTTASCSA